MTEWYRRLLPWVLIGAALVSGGLHRALPAGGLPIWQSPDPDLATITLQQRSTEHRYRFYLLLADRIGGGELVVTEGHGLDPRIANGIGGFRIVESEGFYTDLLPITPKPDEPSGEVATVDGVVPFAILDGPATDRAWLAITPDGYVVVPDTVVPFSEVTGVANG